MSDSFEHNLDDHEDPLPGPTWIVGVLGAVLLSIVILGVTALFFNADTIEIDKKVVTREYPQFNDLKDQQLAQLQGPPRYVKVLENDSPVDTIVIPIDRAMQAYAERAAREQQTSAATSTAPR